MGLEDGRAGGAGRHCRRTLAVARDITEPVDEQSVASADQDDALDAIDHQLDRLNQKVDAIMLVMARSK